MARLHAAIDRASSLRFVEPDGAARRLDQPIIGTVRVNAVLAAIGSAGHAYHLRVPGPDASDAVAPPAAVRRDGQRIRLREATLADAEVVDARAADPAMWGEFNDFGLPRPPSLAENLADGKRMVSRDRGQLLVERIEDGAVIGDVGWRIVSYGPTEESQALNIGAALSPDFRGQGFGAEAQRLLAEALFDLYDVERIEASTDIDNIAEQRSLEKAGFTREGVLRRAQYRAGGRHDLVSYSILREDL